MLHPLHLAVGKAIGQRVDSSVDLICDEACGGQQHIPLFHGDNRARATQFCKVDLLLLKAEKVQVIVEIEESGFNPTKICGKFLTSALATHYIHGRESTKAQYGSKVLFVQILDGSKLSNRGTSKQSQCKLIESQINSLLPLKGSSISKYRLFIIDGPGDKKRLADAAQAVASFV